MKILNLGCGRKYIEGAVNIDIDPTVKADLYGDISDGDLFDDPSLGFVREIGTFDRIICHHLLEHIRDLPILMTNCLLLLKEGGEMDIQVPYDLSYGAWQDPTHVRALNERSWIYYDEWSWYLESYSKEWLQWSLKMKQLEFVLSPFGEKYKDHIGAAEMLTSVPRAIDEMHVILTKTKKEN